MGMQTRVRCCDRIAASVADATKTSCACVSEPKCPDIYQPYPYR